MFGKNASNFQYSVRHFNIGVTENAEMEHTRRSKSDIEKPETPFGTRITEFNI